MKGFHWGHGILVFFIFYVGFLIFTVFKTRTIDRNLVQDNYYNLDINYQDRYDRIANRNALEHDVVIKYNPGSTCVFIDFGSVMKKRLADVRMYRTAGNKTEDINTAFELVDQSEYCLSAENMLPGKWIVELDWNDGSLNYFITAPILIPGA